MSGFENQTYERLKYEVEEKLNRNLTEDEKEPLQWFAVRYVQAKREQESKVYMDALTYISDELLIEAYNRAIKLDLEQDFIIQLKDEIKRRDL